MTRLIIIVAFTALLIAPVASAARGGATLTVDPAAPMVGDALIFTGCGWTTTNRNSSNNDNLNLVWVIVRAPDGNSQTVSVPADKSGCITTDGYLAYRAMSAGGYEVSAFQGGGGKAHQAFLTFNVGP